MRLRGKVDYARVLRQTALPHPRGFLRHPKKKDKSKTVCRTEYVPSLVLTKWACNGIA